MTTEPPVPGAARAPILMLTGPTGAGKTDWAVALAEHAPVEIVSVDSALVYRGLDIGTAKPAPSLRARIPHHLVDICEPNESYSAGRFLRDALASIEAIHARGRVPLLVGGTMLYLRALEHGLAVLPPAAPQLRAQLEARAQREGWPHLHAELARLDPQAASRIKPADRQRIQRALEVCLSTGRPISELQRATVSPLAGWPLQRWVLAPRDRARLHQQLAERFAAMMAAGLLEEVRQLHHRGDLTGRHPAMRAVGYRQLWAYLEGEGTLTDAVSRAIAATRQLAKRQLTWLRGAANGEWIDPDATPRLSWIRDISAWLRRFGL
ncbi:MAG TPA: tRNA (adenosine(37)-N6)-dimethylallyltransferase MiaA [Steroidobacteraceae bacterium]|nr:tRNA (adenosine(37)-N6)-dimethylallyltransferase MiaA [Steroidobacteraceae bacterium]